MIAETKCSVGLTLKKNVSFAQAADTKLLLLFFFHPLLYQSENESNSVLLCFNWI